MAGDKVLSVQGLRKEYGTTTALDDVSFDLHAGEIVGLLGENGAGKSTLIKILAGVVTANQGSVTVRGEVLEGSWSTAHARDAGMAFIHQDPALFHDMTIEENVGLTLGFPTQRTAIDRGALRDRTVALLDRMRIPAAPEDLVGHHSGAVRASIAVAMALSDDASVVVLDEPTATLTVHEAERLFHGVRRIRDTGGTVVLVTHRIDEVMSICDRVVVLRDGALVAEVAVADTTRAELVEYIVGSNVELPSPPEVESREVLLRVEDVVVGGSEPVTLSLHRGEILGLAGPVAAGHEAFAEALFGLREVQTGSITLGGTAYRPATVRDAIARGVGFVPGDRNRDGLVFGFNATENLFLAVGEDVPAPGSRAERRSAESVLGRFDVRPLDPDAEITAFSGGNAQKILIARWLHRSPPLVILCEPTAGVDIGARASIYELILRLSEEGTSFLVVSSDFEEIATLARRAVVFRPRKSPVELTGNLSVARISATALN